MIDTGCMQACVYQQRCRGDVRETRMFNPFCECMNWAISHRSPRGLRDPQKCPLPCGLNHLIRGSMYDQLSHPASVWQPGCMQPIEEARIPMNSRWHQGNGIEKLSCVVNHTHRFFFLTQFFRSSQWFQRRMTYAYVYPNVFASLAKIHTTSVIWTLSISMGNSTKKHFNLYSFLFSRNWRIFSITSCKLWSYLANKTG